ncbi:MAG: GTP cyclohydrolase I FolE [Candidatus Bilamarchaeaceae archaeon]
MEDLVRKLIESVGEDPNRSGLEETPGRVARMFSEILAGYNDDPSKYVKTFDVAEYDSLVLVKDIPFYSMCEHHMLPFFGKAHIAYIPDGKVIGLSKLARILYAFSKRLQVQERITSQVADFIQDALSPQGVAVALEAEHLCMIMRGVKAPGSLTVTSALRGAFVEDARARGEVLALMGLNNSG